MVIKVVTGNRYLGGYIRNTEKQALWIGENVYRWSGTLNIIAVLLQRHLQVMYAGMKNPLQQDGTFVRRINQAMG